MKLAGLHPDEQRRLQSLRSSGLLNSGKEERFDRLTRLARSLYNLPVASISLVGEDLLHIKSCAGLDVDTVPRDISFCAHTILQTDPLIVNDMQQDSAFTITRWSLRRRLSAFTPGIRCNCRMARPSGRSA